jgi:hypothetical protein
MSDKGDLPGDYTALEVATNRVFLMSQSPCPAAVLSRVLAFFKNHALNIGCGEPRLIAARPRTSSSTFRVTMMLCLRRRSAALLAVVLLLNLMGPVFASDGFPFGSELMLDAAPMHGSKRVPMIEIEEDGTASIDLWCASVRAQATVGDMQTAQCEPARQAGDADLLAALGQVTGWRRRGEVIELTGATTLRFRLMTN